LVVPINGKELPTLKYVVLILVVFARDREFESKIFPCKLTVAELIYRIGLTYLIDALPITELVYERVSTIVANFRLARFKLVNKLTTVNSLKVALELEDDIVVG